MSKRNLNPLLLLIVLAVSFLMTSCVDSTPTSNNQSDVVESAYPISTQKNPSSGEDESGYPVSNATEGLKDYYPERLEIPEPGSQTGIVIGRLALNSTNEPYFAAGIFLGKVISENNNEDGTLPSVISISPDSDPLAVQAQDGSFMFTEIEPGEYRIFLWSPMNLYLLNDISTSEEIVVNVNAGEITDLGDIIIE